MSQSLMRIFFVYNGQRVVVDVTGNQKVKEVKEEVRQIFRIAPDEGPIGIEEQDKKRLTLTHAGADLDDEWWFNDIGIIPGSSVKAVLREEKKPTMYIHTKFNGKIVPLYEKVPVKTMSVANFRGLISRTIGLPVSIFRIVQRNGRPMFDRNTLFDYKVELGDDIILHIWDGWAEFVGLCTMGFTYQVTQHISPNEIMAKFQMKVALYIAAHFNHTDLAVAMMRNGIRADEAVGEHPYRVWCQDDVRHVDCAKTPVHEAAENGSENVLRAIVQASVVNVYAKDGNGLNPLNVALRKKQKTCSSFLLTKQWSKMSYTKKESIPLSLFAKMKRWSDRARDKVLVLHGALKSSVKNPRRFVNDGALVGLSVEVDGYMVSSINSRADVDVKFDLDERSPRKQKRMFDVSHEFQPDTDPESYFKKLAMIAKKPYLAKYGKALTQRMFSQRQLAIDETREQSESTDTDTAREDVTDTEPGMFSPELKGRNRQGSINFVSDSAMGEAPRVRFPPIEEKSFIQHNGTSEQPTNKLVSQSYSTFKSNMSEPGEQHKKQRFLKPGAQSVRSIGTTSRTTSRFVSRNEFHKPQQSTRNIKMSVSANKDDETPDRQRTEKETPRRKARSIKSAVLVAKARAENQKIPLPAVSWDSNPRPFVNDKFTEIKETLSLYEKHRGISSRDYAIKCLTVASGFKDKPWLAQVQQALGIATRGVRKVVSKAPHLFYKEPDSSGSEDGQSVMDDEIVEVVNTNPDLLSPSPYALKSPSKTSIKSGGVGVTLK